jgi:hypothetical protein
MNRWKNIASAVFRYNERGFKSRKHGLVAQDEQGVAQRPEGNGWPIIAATRSYL